MFHASTKVLVKSFCAFFFSRSKKQMPCVSFNHAWEERGEGEGGDRGTKSCECVDGGMCGRKGGVWGGTPHTLYGLHTHTEKGVGDGSEGERGGG